MNLETVRTVVPMSRTGVIFELGNALAARDLERALALVRQLLDQGEKGNRHSSRHDYSDRAESSSRQGPDAALPTAATERAVYFWLDPESSPARGDRAFATKKDGSISAFPLGIAAMQAHRFETEQLIAGLEACLAANLQIVTTQLDHQLILNQVVIKLLVSA